MEGRRAVLELDDPVAIHADEVVVVDSGSTDRTLEIYETTQKQTGNVGLAIQAYLRRSASHGAIHCG